MLLRHVIIYKDGRRVESVKEYPMDDEAETMRKIRRTVDLLCPMLCKSLSVYDMDGNLICSKGTDKK